MSCKSRLPDYYNPSENVTIDEQLLGFRGRVSFRQYMPSKPERYGIKFWLLVCANTYYVWKIIPYLGKPAGATAPEKGQGERVVFDLVGSLKGQKVTADNFFITHDLGDKLLEKGITLVGTMRKNKRSIPPKLLEVKRQPLYQSTFAFYGHTTVLLSKMHRSISVGCGEEKKPEIIQYYNKTKGGVDTVDKMLACYSCKRKSKRWPMAVFSNRIDISDLNAFIIYKEVNPNWQLMQKKTMRRNFLRELRLALAKPYMVSRTGAPRSLSAMSLLSNISHEPSASRDSLVSRSSSPVIPPGSSSSSREGSSSMQSPEIPQKRAKSVPPQPQGRSRCNVCYEEQASTKHNMHGLICCFCSKGICKARHNQNVCVKCMAENLI